MHDGAAQLPSLLATAWPSLPEVMALAARWGAEWSDLSTPLLARDGDRLIAHVGVMPVQLVVDGAPVDAAAIHAVCTDPAHRRRGHASRALQAALSRCEAQGRALQALYAVEPPLYARHGFTPVAQHVLEWIGPRPPARPGRALDPLRVEDDRARLLRAVARRRATARSWDLQGPAALYRLNLALHLRHGLRFTALDGPEAIVVHARRGEELHVWDILGDEVELREALAAFPVPEDTLILRFDATAKAPRAAVRPRPRTDGDILMLRGGPRPTAPSLVISPLITW